MVIIIKNKNKKKVVVVVLGKIFYNAKVRVIIRISPFFYE